MPTVEQRYVAATEYVRRAIAVVESRGVVYAVDPVTGFVEWYAGKVKTEQPRRDLVSVEARWLRAVHDADRSRIARDAELLADRVQENLPGAPQNRARTNLFPGESAKATAPTSYYGEAATQAGEAWSWMKDTSATAAEGVSNVGKWLLLGGGVVLGWKALDYLRKRERSRLRGDSGRLRGALNASLVRAAARS